MNHAARSRFDRKKISILLLLGITFCLLPTKSDIKSVHEIDNCLSSESCDIERDCSQYYYTDDCLKAVIPLFTRLNTLSCCFRCCLGHVLGAYSLIIGERANERKTNIHFETGIHSSRATLFTALLGFSSISSVSDTVYTQETGFSIGKPTIHRIAIAISNNSCAKIGGRNIILITFLKRCTESNGFIENVIHRSAQYGNPRVSYWFNNQILCPVNNFSLEALSIDTSANYVADSTKLFKRHKMSLIPSGIWNISMFHSVSLNYNKKNLSHDVWQSRRLILNCGCMPLQANRVVPPDLSTLKRLLSSFQSCSDTYQIHFNRQDSYPIDFSSDLAHDPRLEPWYHSLFQSKFVLVSSRLDQLGPCEWEALAAGAVPVMRRDILTHPAARDLYSDLPILQYDSLDEITPEKLDLAEEAILRGQLLRDTLGSAGTGNITHTHHYNLAKVFFPYWLGKLAEGLLGGSFLRRPWNRTLTLLQQRLSSPLMTCHRLKSFSDARPKAMKPKRSRSRGSGMRGGGSRTGGGRRDRSRALTRSHGTDALGSTITSGFAENYRLNRSNWAGVDDACTGHSESPSSRPPRKNRWGVAHDEPSSVSTSTLRDVAPAETVLNSPASQHHSSRRTGLFDRQLSSVQPSSCGPNSSVNKSVAALIELVVPRCCEKRLELDWLEHLLLSYPCVHATVYYKCAHCLPASRAGQWGPQVREDPVLAARLPQRVGIRVLEDGFLTRFGSRVRQTHRFDYVINGKEAAAYLQHIVDNYDNLARQTFFLHSDPASHLSFESFMRALIWIITCKHPWGSCCGYNSSCKASLYQYLGIEVSAADATTSVATYKGGQFVAADYVIRNQSLSFWRALLRLFDARNASSMIHLPGCVVYKDWSRGPLIGSQLERLWHTFLGRGAVMSARVVDESLPMYLRSPECTGFRNCYGAV